MVLTNISSGFMKVFNVFLWLLISLIFSLVLVLVPDRFQRICLFVKPINTDQ